MPCRQLHIPQITPICVLSVGSTPQVASFIFFKVQFTFYFFRFFKMCICLSDASVYGHVCARKLASWCLCGGQRSAPGGSFCYSPYFFFFRQGLSLSKELTVLARLAGQQLPAAICLHHPPHPLVGLQTPTATAAVLCEFQSSELGSSCLLRTCFTQ